MSNLSKKRKDLIIDDKEYVMMFDMKSIDVFKEISGKSFLNSIALLDKYDDKTILEFMASTIRLKEDETNPLGMNLLKYDPIFLLLNYTHLVMELVFSSLPKAEENIKKKEIE